MVCQENSILGTDITSILTISFSFCFRTLDGYTNILLYGNEVRSNCNIVAEGTTQADAVITVDFGTGSCTGNTVTLDEGIIKIDGNKVVSFGSSFKDIIFIMSSCDDQVFITKSYRDASSIEINGADGNDSIELGDASQGLESLVFANIILDGGKGTNDKLTVHDESSKISKPGIEIRPTLMTGIHGNAKQTISYFDVEDLNIELGNSPADITVFSTAKNTSLTLTTQGMLSFNHQHANN